MITPQQIQEVSFERALFGGYDMDSVNEFFDPLTEDYIALYKENSVLKSKMRILVEKLEEYRKQESSMQSALLAAQKTSEQMPRRRKSAPDCCTRPRRPPRARRRTRISASARSRSALRSPSRPRRSSSTGWSAAFAVSLS